MTAAGSKTRRLLDPLWLASPAVVVLVAFFLLPAFVLAIDSVLTGGVYRFGAEGPLTTSNYPDVIAADGFWKLVGNTMIIGVATGVITVALGLGTAYWLRFCAGRLRNLVLLIVVLSLFVSFLVRVYAWRTILGDTGVLNSALETSGLTDDPLSFLLFSRVAIIVALVHLLLPIAILMLYSGLQSLEPRYLDAVEDLGSGPVDRWRRLVLPLMASPIVAAFMLVFVLASADYVTPQLLGGPGDAPIGVQVQTYLRTLGDYARGAALGVMTLGVYLTIFLALRGALRTRNLHRIVWPKV